MSKSNIEVEIRSFISQSQYNKLLNFFKSNSELVKEDKQETIYFDSKEDLRIQKNNFTSKIWLKGGELHDDCREEIEIHTQRDNFSKLQKLFNILGYKENIKWIRDRKQFNWDDIKVCLDYTLGYGYILELEKISSKKDEEKVLDILRSKLKELKIEETPKEEFNKAFEYYSKNWRELIKNK